MSQWILQFSKMKTRETTEMIQGSVSTSAQNIWGYTEAERMEATLEEAQSNCPFTIQVPEYLPFDSSERKVFMEKLDQAFFITLEYYSGDKLLLTILQKKYAGDYEYAISYDTDDSVIEEISFKNAVAHLIVFKSDVTILTWNQNQIHHEIKGRIGKEEIIRIAESLK